MGLLERLEGKEGPDDGQTETGLRLQKVPMFKVTVKELKDALTGSKVDPEHTKVIDLLKGVNGLPDEASVTVQKPCLEEALNSLKAKGIRPKASTPAPTETVK